MAPAQYAVEMYCSWIIALTCLGISCEGVGVDKYMKLRRGPARPGVCPVNFTMTSYHNITSNATDGTAQSNAIGSQKTTPIYQTNSDSLYTALQKESLFVVFYAPWCPHCKTIREGGQDSVVNQINRVLQAQGGPRVVLYNTDQGSPGVGFQVQYVPEYILAGKHSGGQFGLRANYEGDHHDVQAVKAFVAGHGFLGKGKGKGKKKTI